MRIELPKRIKNLRREFQRWNFRRIYESGKKVDCKNQLKAIAKAEKLSKRRKCRLWVIREMPGKYWIYSKGDVKAVLRRLGLKGRIDLFELSDTVVHITK